MKNLIENTAEKLQIDRNNWTKVKFGMVALQQKKSVDRDKTNLTFYVKGEHMGSQDLHLREWGELTDEYLGPAFIRYFEKGDILYGSRRTYLRKVVIAPFEGITSNTTLVIKANEKIIDKRFLPFVMMSEGFTDHSIKNSKGSVNPYINWKDLANYEFLLPPKAEQARLAELLWAMDEVIEKEKTMLGKLESSFKSTRNHFIENGSFDSTKNSKKTRFGKICTNWQVQKLSSFAELINGYAFKSDEFQESGKFQVLRIGNITDNGFDYSKSAVFKNLISESEKKFLIPKGAIVLSLTGTNGRRDYGFPSLMEDDKKFLLNQRLVMIIPKKEVMLPEFLFLISKMELFQGRFFLNATGTANQANVSSSDVGLIELPVPPIQVQIKFLVIIDSLSLGITNSKKKIAASQSLQKSLINQIF